MLRRTIGWGSGDPVFHRRKLAVLRRRGKISKSAFKILFAPAHDFTLRSKATLIIDRGTLPNVMIAPERLRDGTIVWAREGVAESFDNYLANLSQGGRMALFAQTKTNNAGWEKSDSRLHERLRELMNAAVDRKLVRVDEYGVAGSHFPLDAVARRVARGSEKRYKRYEYGKLYVVTKLRGQVGK